MIKYCISNLKNDFQSLGHNSTEFSELQIIQYSDGIKKQSGLNRDYKLEMRLY